MQHTSSRRRFLKNAAKNTAWVGGGALLGAAAVNQAAPRIWPESLKLEPNRGYWARSQPAPNPALAGDLTVDFAVLGGGFTGLSAAYFIRSVSPHKSVVVLSGCRSLASRPQRLRIRDQWRSAGIRGLRGR
jgi:hypothetical protein